MLTKQMLQRSERGIDNSEFYMVLVTDNMLKDEQCLYEWNYAKHLKKPFMLVIKAGTKIPNEMLSGINIKYKASFNDDKDLEKISLDIKNIIGEMKFIDSHE